MTIDTSEDAVEQVALEQFRQLGWQVAHGSEIAPEQPGAD